MWHALYSAHRFPIFQEGIAHLFKCVDCGVSLEKLKKTIGAQYWQRN